MTFFFLNDQSINQLLKEGQNTDLLKKVCDLDQFFIAQFWTLEQWHQEIVSPHSKALILSTNAHELKGFAYFHLYQEAQTAHLLKIVVDPQKRGTGLTQDLWNEAELGLKKLHIQVIDLEVEEQNLRAVHFYKKVGFSVTRVLKGFYSNGAQALKMTKQLS
jgi:ribosomal protein S18 acetylase RimI-like enzyme